MIRIVTVGSIAIGLMMGGLIGSKGTSRGNQPSALTEGGSRCPAIYAPVICDNGRTYPNQCEADQHHAKNCRPLGV
jgi:hypothetical protein